MVAVLVAGGVLCVAVIAEWLHARRTRIVGRLAFGPAGEPALWARFAPLARVLAVAALAWGLVTLILVDPMVHRSSSDVPDTERRHILLVLDVSPSMRLQDAGAEGDESRMHRARDVLESLLSRVGIRQCLITVVATYNGAIPIVEKSRDPEVVRNVLNDLPMHHAFEKGDTDLFAGLEEAARIAEPWNRKSATLLLVSDGDTVPATGMPDMPGSIGYVLVVGVGDPAHGTFLDGRHSRQDVSMLRQIAVRLRGSYHNGNESHVPGDLVRAISTGGNVTDPDRWQLREYALLATICGALVLALLPPLLLRFGTAWFATERRKVTSRSRPRIPSHASGNVGTREERTIH
jgi:Ca-activated chloride channel homolog